MAGLPEWRCPERLRRSLRCLAPVALAAGLGTGLGACHDNLSAAASADADTCYALPTGSTAKKVVIGPDDENLETCAMHVEGWRLQHRLPSATGFYEAHYIYNSASGITAAASDTGLHYSVYTKAEQADLDAKLHLLISQAAAGGNTTGGVDATPADTTAANAATANKAGD